MRQILQLFLIALLLLGGILSSPSIADQTLSVTPGLKTVSFIVPKPIAPNMSPVQRVADPYCPNGITSCGQFCDMAVGRYTCDRTAVCCYGPSGKGECIFADKCR
jgi:hypothetical protein